MNTGTIYGVSLGTGDPDLITLKGLNILKKVAKIYYPGSLFKNGGQSSYSLSILKHYDLNPNKLEGFYLRMDLDRVQVQEIYEATFQKIRTDYNNGLSIAIVSEGDLSTYSSFSYLLEKIKAAHLPVNLVPGVSSFLHLASQVEMPLCLQNEKVVVIPRIQHKNELQEAITHFDTVILMKIVSVVAVIASVIDTQRHTITYGERLGTDKQFVTQDWEIVKQREIPYFSLLIIKKK